MKTKNIIGIQSMDSPIGKAYYTKISNVGDNEDGSKNLKMEICSVPVEARSKKSSTLLDMNNMSALSEEYDDEILKTIFNKVQPTLIIHSSF